MDFTLVAQFFARLIFFALHIGSPNLFPKPLSKKDEDDAVKKAINGDINARNLLIEHNLRLVVHIIKKYYANNSDQDDLISIGTIGLIKGINSFRPDKNVRLATYASRCIEMQYSHYGSYKKGSCTYCTLNGRLADFKQNQ